MAKPVRVQFDISRGLLRSIDQLAEAAEMSRVDVVREGMALLLEYVQRKKDGCKLFYVPGQSSEKVEIVLPRYNQAIRSERA